MVSLIYLNREVVAARITDKRDLWNLEASLCVPELKFSLLALEFSFAR